MYLIDNNTYKRNKSINTIQQVSVNHYIMRQCYTTFCPTLEVQYFVTQKSFLILLEEAAFILPNAYI